MDRVIVVDVEEDDVRRLVLGLRSEGFDAVGTHDPERVVDMLRADPVDIAIVELMMHGTTGLKLARRVRAECPAARVVLMSSYQVSERQLKHADCGVVGFVPKPYVISELAAFLWKKLSRPHSVAQPSPLSWRPRP